MQRLQYGPVTVLTLDPCPWGVPEMLTSARGLQPWLGACRIPDTGTRLSLMGSVPGALTLYIVYVCIYIYISIKRWREKWIVHT